MVSRCFLMGEGNPYYNFSTSQCGPSLAVEIGPELWLGNRKYAGLGMKWERYVTNCSVWVKEAVAANQRRAP